MRFPIFRVIGVLIGVGVIGYGGLCIYASWYWNNKIDRYAEARLFDIAVDLSEAGEYSVAFEQVCSLSHGQEVEVELPAEWLAGHNAEKVLGDLRFACVITDADGEVVVSSIEDGRVNIREAWDGVFSLFYFYPFPIGEYTLTFTVKEGLEVLAGVEQRLVMRYMLCGSERRGAYTTFWYGVGSFIIGGGIIVSVIIVTWRKRAKVAEAEAGTDANELTEGD